MNPSSSNFEPFDFLVAAGPAAAATTARSWLQAMLDVEAALAAAQASLGVIPPGTAEEIAAACAADRFDVAAVFAAAAAGGNPVIALLPELRRLAGSSAEYVHRGATSQDILDTAAMLVVRRCTEAVAEQLVAATAAVERVAAAHGAVAMVGRTLMQHALPITFGLVLQSWAGALTDGATELRRIAARLPVQLGGPVGDPVSLGPPEVVAAVASRLDLQPAPSWHAQRSVITSIAGAWGAAASAASGIATDVVLLASSDIAELAEHAPGAGGSSSMAHKHNPIAAISARAAAMQAPGHVAVLLQAAGSHELQRAAGAWHAEWPALQGLLRCTGSAVHWLTTSISRLSVDEQRMATNLATAMRRLASPR